MQQMLVSLIRARPWGSQSKTVCAFPSPPSWHTLSCFQAPPLFQILTLGLVTNSTWILLHGQFRMVPTQTRGSLVLLLPQEASVTPVVPTWASAWQPAQSFLQPVHRSCGLRRAGEVHCFCFSKRPPSGIRLWLGTVALDALIFILRLNQTTSLLTLELGFFSPYIVRRCA